MTTPLTTAPTAKAVLPIGLLIAVLAMVAVLLLPLPVSYTHLTLPTTPYV